MKKYILIILLGLGIWSCYQEDDIHVPDEVYRRTYDTNSTDPVLKYVSKYYFDCGRLFIVDPDTADYVYNLQNKNQYRIVRLPQDKDYLLKGIEMTEDLFLNGYSVETRKKIFPFTVIIADTLWDSGGYIYAKSQNTLSSTSLFALALPESVLAFSEAEKVNRSREIQKSFLKDFVIKFDHMVVPLAFYSANRALYGEDVPPKKENGEERSWTQEEIYEAGFVKFDGWWTQEYPLSYKDDAACFIDLLLEKSSEEVENLRSTYPLLKKRLDLIVEMLESYGIDYRKLVYKAKE